MPSETSTPSFSFQALGLGSVLKLHRLGVPMFQREYSWKREMVDQLFRDLAKAMQDQSDYFLGTVVTVPDSRGEVLNIVDGQQRLTTTAIFMSAIRDYVLEQAGPENLIVESIENEFLSIIDRGKNRRVPRLQLNVDDRSFFDQLINRGGVAPAPTRESHRRLLKAKEAANSFVRALVGTFDENARIRAINEWIGFLEQKANVILLKAPDSASAFRMFETLNDRGLKTSQADLVKNYLFEEATDRVVEAQARWSSMLSTLEEIEDEERHLNFLRHVIIATRAFTRADRVFNTVQSRVQGETNSLQFLSDLERLATTYVATYRPDSELWNGYPPAALKAIRVLSLLDLKPFRPLILAVAEKFEPTEGAKALALFVSIGVRILIAGRTNSGQIEQACAQAALNAYRKEYTTAKELREALDKIIPNDEEFEQLFSTATSSKTALARYYLHSLERAQEDDPEPYFETSENPDTITLEHILPKNPGPNWPQFDPEDVKRFSVRIGNLCLLNKSSNNHLRSAGFEEKRPILKEAPYVLTSEVAQFAEWTPKSIVERQRTQAALAIKAWPVGRLKK